MKKLLGMGMGLALAALAAMPATALTSVTDPWDSGSPSDPLNLYEVYNAIYGTNFTSTDGITGGDEISGGMDSLRVEPDQLFDYTEDGSAAFMARYAAFDQTFGYYTDDEDGLNYTPLFTSILPSGAQIITESTDNVVVIDTTLLAGENVGFFDYAFRESDPENGWTWHSEVVRNNDEEDHMVAFYALVYNEETEEWDIDESRMIIAFEDLNGLGDADYNDLVVEVTLNGDVNTHDPVSEPETVGLLLLGLAGTAIRRRFTA